MKIAKYKKMSKGRYKVFLEDDREYIFYEEVILQYNLLIKKELSEELLIEADQCNQEWDVYYVALNSIQNRFRSVFELRTLLLKKEYPYDLVEKAIQKLIKQGYLNDESYAKSYVNNQMITTNKGPYKLSRELQEKKVESNYIDEALIVFTEEEQQERIQKLVDRSIKSNHSRGGVVLKQKIYQDIKNMGYDISVLNQVISHYSFENDFEIAKKEYEKYYRKYSRKYEGEELKQKIREKLYQKGLKYEEE